MSTLIYYIGLAFLLTHELDAIRHAEWQLLYVLRGMDEEKAYSLFVALHVPIFVGLFWLSHHPNPRVLEISRATMSGFFVLHAVLHFRLSGTANYGFEGALSNTLIYGAGLAGLAYLAISARLLRRPVA